MTELEAWRYLAQHREAGLESSFVEFFDDGDDKVMCAPTDEDSKQVFCVARASSFAECAVQLAELLQCSVGDQQRSASSTASASDAAISATDGGRSDECGETPAAAEAERTNAPPATRTESEPPETSDERQDSLLTDAVGT